MHPSGAGKRKRGDPNFSYDGNNDGSNRPSPHRPSDMGHAQRNQYGQQNGNHRNTNQQYGNHQQNYQQTQYGGGRGGRRGYNNRGGGRGGPHAPGHGPGSVNDIGARSVVSREGQTHVEDVSVTSSAPQVNDTAPSKGSQSQAPTQSERPTPTPLPTPAPAAMIMSPPAPPSVIAPYAYQLLTDDVRQAWNGTGRQAVRAAAANAYSDQDVIGLSTVMQELLRAGLDGKLDTDEAGKTVEMILAAAPDDAGIDGASLFLDTLSILMDADASNTRAKFVVTATGIPASLMREQLDEPLLQTLGLIRPTFGRMFIRKQTHALYRQSNYNLLREETEGYSKLVTELFTTSSDLPPSGEVVSDLFENIKALIGAFDLDAGRVLDVTLDVFASLLVKHNRFFIKLLRVSSWWPQEQSSSGVDFVIGTLGTLPVWAQPGHSDWVSSEEDKDRVSIAKKQRDTAFWVRAREVGMDAFFELGGRRILGDHDLNEEIDAASKAENTIKTDTAAKAKEVRARETRKWIQSTRTLPPPGNPVAAQLLGFKLRFYASQGRDVDDTLPQNLIYLTALLIKIGFISLRDLYAHLFPTDESMEDVKTKHTKEKEEREMAKRPGGGALNALARASALPDDTVPPVNLRLKDIDTRPATPAKGESASSKAGTPAPLEEEEKVEPLPEPADQKIQLLKSLLCIGAIPEALYMIGRFPWLMDVIPDLPEHIHRILHYSLSKVCDDLTPLRAYNGLREAAKIATVNPNGSSKGSVKLTDSAPSKFLRWAKLDKNNVEGGNDYRFYWDDWSDNVPVCQNVDDVFTLCATLLNLSGIKIGQDTSLLVKLARIGKQSLNQDFSKMNQDRWLDLCKRLLAPALSLTKANPGVVSEIYEVFKFFPTQTRYGIYAEWFTGQISRLPDVVSAFNQTTLETKDVLRRLTKANMRSMARTLAKTSCASPGVVFTTVLNQIESYENLIDVVVECGRYFTYMGYDVLTWSIMSAMSKAGRSRIASDGINTSSWLNALALFAGKIFKRYSTMNALPLLQYVQQQVVKGNFTDLLVLRELISNMTGIIADTDFTIPQVLAMSGGEILRGMTLRQVHDKRHESKASGKRLMKCIVDNDLAGSLLIAIAHARQSCNFDPDQSSLKVIGENFDDIQRVLIQYLDMVQTNLAMTDFQSVVPDIPSLLREFGLEPSVAFAIHRKGISRAIEEYDAAHPAEKKERRKSQEDLATSGDVDAPEAQDDAMPVDENTDANIEKALEGENRAVESEQTSHDVDMAEAPIADAPTPPVAIDTSVSPWHPVLDNLMNGVRRAVPEDFENRLSLSFFVSFWQLSLHDMMAPLSSYDAEIKRQKDRLAAIGADRTDVSTAGLKKKETEKRAIMDLLERLRLEMKGHLQSYSVVRTRLQLEKESWFKDFLGRWQILSTSILQECFIPRLLISPMDSHFTQKMLFFLHTSGAPGFRTMYVLDRLFGDKMLANLIFMCSAHEADNLGRFLMEILKELSSWHKDKTVYEKKAYGTKKDLPGFAKRLDKAGKPEVLLDYEDFRRLLYRWHKNLLDAIKSCMASTEYMRLKNAIMVSKCVATYFPAVNWMGSQLNSALTEIAKTEDGVRPDLCVAANSQLGNLKGMEKKWVMPQAFYIPIAGAQQSSRPASAAPQSEPAGAKQFDATAAPFDPKSLIINKGNKSTASISGKLEVEDGEVDDSEMTDAASKKPVVVTGAAIEEATKQTEATEPPSITSTTTKAETTMPHLIKPEGAPTPVITVNAPNAIPKVPSVSGPESNEAASERPRLSRQNSTAAARGAHTLPNRPEVRADGRVPSRVPSRPQDSLTGRGRGASKAHDDGRLERPSGLDREARRERDATPSRSDTRALSRHNADETIHELPRQPDARPQQRNDQLPRSYTQDYHGESRESGSGQHLNERRSDISQPQAQIQADARRHTRELQAPGDPNDPNSTPINPKRRGFAEPPPEPAAVQQSTRAVEQQLSRSDDRRLPLSRSHSKERQTPTHHDGRSDGPRDNRSRVYDRPLLDAMQHSNGERAADYAPNGPRDNRNTRLGYQPSAPPNDSNQALPGSRQSLDRQQNRMSHDLSRHSRHQDINYGRLNADDEPVTAPPQVMTAIRGERDFVMPTPPADSRQGLGRNMGQASHRDAAPERVPGPQDNRMHEGYSRRDISNSTHQASSTTPAVPMDMDTSGVHPSRLQQLDPDDRMPPLRLQTGPSARQPRQNDSNISPSSIPPSGPRSNQQRYAQDVSPVNNNASSPISRNPPTGPASNTDRRRESRRFQGLADALQQSGPPSPGLAATPNFDTSISQGTSIRGMAMAQAGRVAQFQSSSQNPPPQPLVSSTHRHGVQPSNYDDVDPLRRNSAFIHPHHAQPQVQGQNEVPFGGREETNAEESRDRPRGEHDNSRQRSSRESSRDHRRDRDPLAVKDAPQRSDSHHENREPRERGHRHDDRRTRDPTENGHRERDSGRGPRDEYAAGGGGGRRNEPYASQNLPSSQRQQQVQAPPPQQQQQQVLPPRRDPLPPQELIGPAGAAAGYYNGDGGGDKRGGNGSGGGGGDRGGIGGDSRREHGNNRDARKRAYPGGGEGRDGFMGGSGGHGQDRGGHGMSGDNKRPRRNGP